MKRSAWLAVALVCLVPAAGCKKKAPTEAGGSGGAGGGGGGGGGAGGAGGGGTTAKGGKGCELPSENRVTKDTSLTKGCSLTVDARIEIDEGATLTIEPGARLSFAPNAHFAVANGRLVAKGTAKEPIVFTSANKSPAAGDWGGIIFQDHHMTGNVLDWTVIEYAGNPNIGEGAAVTVQAGAPGRITITNSKIRESQQYGVYNGSEKTAFAKLDGNTFSKNPKASLAVQVAVLGSVGSGNTIDTPVHVFGSHIAASQTWPKLGVPIVFDDSVHVGGEQGAAIVTFAEGTVLKFAMDRYLAVGNDNGGGLVGKSVTFTSANGTPSAGDWRGLIFEDKATSTNLEGCTIEYAGREGGDGPGAIVLKGSAKANKQLKVTKTTIRHSKHAIHAEGGDCGDFAAAASGNKADGVPLCNKE